MHDAQMDETANSVAETNTKGTSHVLLVCEHASHAIPTELNDLGLSAGARTSHIAWDPGALAVSSLLASHLDARLIASTVSRLVYDCNRPPDAAGAMISKSEHHVIPGNQNLDPAQRADRARRFYTPFRDAVARAVESIENPILVTIHSFTPVYAGHRRDVEIGVLHDKDTRLADALLDVASLHSSANVQRNQPYGPEHGVTHTLKEHALPRGHLNVMLEFRSDLIATVAQQAAMASMFANWLIDACDRVPDTQGEPWSA